jgi:hypothetical protein
MFYLYTLDVSEAEVGRAFAPDAAQEPAHTIARAILDRESQRIRTRRQYEQQQGSAEPPLLP